MDLPQADGAAGAAVGDHDGAARHKLLQANRRAQVREYPFASKEPRFGRLHRRGRPAVVEVACHPQHACGDFGILRLRSRVKAATVDRASDPIVGRQDDGATFTIPKEPVRRRVHGIETFNVLRGGEYLLHAQLVRAAMVRRARMRSVDQFPPDWQKSRVWASLVEE